jgi:hypothetical protein
MAIIIPACIDDMKVAVCRPVNRAVISTVIPLMTRRKRPRVNRVKGNETTTSIGLMMALTTANISAAKNSELRDGYDMPEMR